MWISSSPLLRKLASSISFLSLYFVCLLAHAESGRTDYDIDNDGLIEINDLDDLHAIRQSLSGTTLYGKNTGCKRYGNAEICNGFELTRDLDFDTNSDGVINNQDKFWNGSFGWDPIGQQFQPFKATFDGNGFVIRNLVVNRSGPGGLFGYVEKATIRSVGLSGDLALIKGRSSLPIGSLASVAKDSWISNIFSTVNLQATIEGAGGIIGRAENTDLRNSFSSGYVFGANYAGGLVGYSKDSKISYSFATGLVIGNDSSGGLIGIVENESPSHDSSYKSYWAGSETNQASLYGDLSNDSLPELIKEGLKTISDLKCPQSKYDDQCGENTIYSEWSTSGGFSHWDFGNADVLPGLVFATGTRRDSDGDGSLDDDDKWPNNYAASFDSDLDGFPDRWTAGCDADCRANSGLKYDNFPLDKRFYLDEDLDGLPDAVNQDFCDVTCQASLDISIDEYLNDRDNDGIPDSVDDDDNNDDKQDIDRDSDGLIDIETVEQLNAVRNSLDGAGIRVTAYQLDVSGCPVTYSFGKRVIQCHGYELFNNIDFDTDSNGAFDENDAYWNNGAGWEPIGKDAKRFSDINFEQTENGNVTTRFQAVFEGNGFEIKNLVINRSGYDNIGFFGYAYKAEIRNVNFVGALTRVAGDENVGGVVGHLHDSVLRNVSHVGQVNGTNRTGGVVGVASSSFIENVKGISTVNGGSMVGGILGYANFATRISSSQFDGFITAGSDTGGLAGYVNNGSQIDHSFVTGTVTGSGQNTGGLVGYLRTSAISKSFVSGKVVNDSSYTGGIVGRAIYHSMILNCFATGEINGSSYTGGLAGYVSDTSINNCFVANNVNTSSSSHGGLIGYKKNSGLFENSYWASDRASTDRDYYWDGSRIGPKESFGHALSEMQCVQAPDDFVCSSNILFKSWNAGLSSPTWSFGTVEQLPGLILNGVVYQDSDGDGILDSSDEYPFDTDNDGRNNSVDYYPFISLNGNVDTDQDGIPDDCDQACMNLGMTADIDDDNDNVLDNVDLYPKVSVIGLLDTDNDGAPDTCDTECLNKGMKADIDDDNDGVLDEHDEYPKIALHGRTDTDGDGIPNVCDEPCQKSGMAEDLDDDGDGVADLVDYYPLISLGALDDTDNDGIPNVCDVHCRDRGMHEDLDDDNDGIPDLSDFYPLISLGDNIDADQDGIPDDCPEVCKNSGMSEDLDDDNDGVLDQLDDFPLNQAASLDADKDGRPDSWNDSCVMQCQLDSGLVLDTQLNDFDNDGVIDDLDTDNSSDNGLPIISILPEAKHLPVSDAQFQQAELNVSDWMSEVSAYDVVDSALSFTVTINNSAIELADLETVSIPSGLNKVTWIARDDAGNRSAPKEQLIYVYPQVRFTALESKTGEFIDSKVGIELTGESPVYPVNVSISALLNEGSVDQNDLVDGNSNSYWDLTQPKDVLFERHGDDQVDSVKELIVPFINDGVLEGQDETLFLKLVSIGDLEQPFTISTTHSQHKVVVTDTNLAPALDVVVEQDGWTLEGDDSIRINGGQVQVSANVSDANGDSTSVHWELFGIQENIEDSVTSWEFDPSILEQGAVLQINVKAIDDGSPSQSTSITRSLSAEMNVAPELEISIEQDGVRIDPSENVVIQASGGVVKVSAVVSDANDDDTLLKWNASELLLGIENNVTSWEFLPSTLRNGQHRFSAEAVDSRDTSLVTSLSISFTIETSGNDSKGASAEGSSGSGGGGVLGAYYLALLILLQGVYNRRRVYKH